MGITSQLRRSVALAAGAGVIAIVLTATGAGPAIAQSARPLLTLIVNDASRPVPVQTVGSTRTHLGPADVVQLRWASDLDCFRQVVMTGPWPADCYVPPAGRTLIITDVQWELRIPAGASTNLWIYSRENADTVFLGSAVAGSSEFVTNDHHFQTGFIFDVRLRPTAGDARILLNGYLVASE